MISRQGFSYFRRVNRFSTSFLIGFGLGFLSRRYLGGDHNYVGQQFGILSTSKIPRTVDAVQVRDDDAYGINYCRERYVELFVRLGDKLCDNGIENGDGSWCRDPNKYGGGDVGLAKGLLNLFNAENAQSVIDFGAGGGWYAEFLTQNGVDTRAYDGAVGSKVQPLSETRRQWFDQRKEIGFTSENPFANVIKLPLSFYHGSNIPSADWVYSIEVGEHLPREYEDVFVRNLVEHAKEGLVLTWAMPKQSGRGHVNCKEKEDVIVMFEAHGMLYKDELTNDLVGQIKQAHLQRNVMVFKRF